MMDNERIEKMLRESWRPQPREGMRERVLGKARERTRSRQSWFRPRWQTAFALAGAVVILFSYASDSARMSRLAAIGGGAGPRGRSLVASRPITMADWRIEMDRLTNDSPGTPH